MKQRKILDLNDSISIEVTPTEAWLTTDKSLEPTSFTLEEIKQLRDWLTNEVLQDTPSQYIPNIVNIPAFSIPQTIAEKLNIQGPTASGPLTEIPQGQSDKTALENRRAVNTTNKSGGLTSIPNISPVDGLEIQNLSSQIGRAKQAFSPERIFDGKPSL